MIVDYDGSVLAQSAMKWRVDQRQNRADVVDIKNPTSVLETNQLYMGAAAKIWKKRPLRELGFAVDKVLIAFGLRVNRLVDVSIGIFVLLALGASLWALRLPTIRPWGLMTLSVAGVLIVQAGLFQADRRFVVPTLFPVAVVPVTAAIEKALKWLGWVRKISTPAELASISTHRN